MKKIICALLACVLLLGTMCSCAKKVSPFDKSWIIEADGEKISSDIYAYYVYCAYEMYSYYGAINEESPLKKQYIPVEDENGKEKRVRADKQINSYALERTLNLYYIQKQYGQAGLTLGDDTLKSIKELAAYEYDAYRALFEKNGISEDTVALASASGKVTQMEDELFINDNSDVTDEALSDYYLNNYVAYAYISQKLLDAEGVPLDDSEKDVIRNEMASVVSKVKNGSTDISELALEYINAVSDDPKCGKGGKSLSTVEWGESDLMNELKGMSAGDVKYVEIKNCGYVIKKYDLSSTGFFDDEANRTLVLKSMRYGEWKEELEKNIANLDYTLNVSAFNKYGINNFKTEGDEK